MMFQWFKKILLCGNFVIGGDEHGNTRNWKCKRFWFHIGEHSDGINNWR